MFLFWINSSLVGGIDSLADAWFSIHSLRWRPSSQRTENVRSRHESPKMTRRSSVAKHRLPRSGQAAINHSVSSKLVLVLVAKATSVFSTSNFPQGILIMIHRSSGPCYAASGGRCIPAKLLITDFQQPGGSESSTLSVRRASTRDSETPTPATPALGIDGLQRYNRCRGWKDLTHLRTLPVLHGCDLSSAHRLQRAWRERGARAGYEAWFTRAARLRPYHSSQWPEADHRAT